MLGPILSAPVVVTSWISLQYCGSSVAPQTFGVMLWAFWILSLEALTAAR